MTTDEWEELTDLLEKGKSLSPEEWAIHTDLPTYRKDEESIQARALNSRVATLLNQGILTEDEVRQAHEG